MALLNRYQESILLSRPADYQKIDDEKLQQFICHIDSHFKQVLVTGSASHEYPYEECQNVDNSPSARETIDYMAQRKGGDGFHSADLLAMFEYDMDKPNVVSTDKSESFEDNASFLKAQYNGNANTRESSLPVTDKQTSNCDKSQECSDACIELITERVRSRFLDFFTNRQNEPENECNKIEPIYDDIDNLNFKKLIRLPRNLLQEFSVPKWHHDDSRLPSSKLSSDKIIGTNVSLKLKDHHLGDEANTPETYFRSIETTEEEALLEDTKQEAILEVIVAEIDSTTTRTESEHSPAHILIPSNKCEVCYGYDSDTSDILSDDVEDCFKTAKNNALKDEEEEEEKKEKEDKEKELFAKLFTVLTSKYSSSFNEDNGAKNMVEIIETEENVVKLADFKKAIDVLMEIQGSVRVLFEPLERTKAFQVPMMEEITTRAYLLARYAEVKDDDSPLFDICDSTHDRLMWSVLREHFISTYSQ